MGLPFTNMREVGKRRRGCILDSLGLKCISDNQNGSVEQGVRYTHWILSHQPVFYLYLFLKFPPRTGHDTELGMLTTMRTSKVVISLS